MQHFVGLVYVAFLKWCMIVKHWKLAFIMMSKDGHKALFCVTVRCDDQDLWWLGLWWIKGTTNWTRFITTFKAPRSEWSWIKNLDPDFPKGKYLMSVLFMTYCVHLGAKTSGAQNDCFLYYHVWRSKYCLEFSIT